MKGLIGLATVFAAANAGTDMIKDTLYGRPIKDRKSTRLNSSHSQQSRMPSSA